MALIYCRQCGKKISDMARACPGCGAPSIPYVSNAYNSQGYNNNDNLLMYKKKRTLNLVGLIMMLIGSVINIITFLITLITGGTASFTIPVLIVFVAFSVCVILSLIKIKPFVFTLIASILGIIVAGFLFFGLSITIIFEHSTDGITVFYMFNQLVIVVGCIFALLGLKGVR